MSEYKMNHMVDEFLSKAKKWKDEFSELRRIILECGLTEEIKWMNPCYTLEDKNVVLIHGFKEYCAILFIKGVLLNDHEGVLIQQTENVQAGRQIRFTNLKEILDMENVIKAYIKEAIEIEESGQEVELKKTSEYKIPEEFKTVLEGNPDLKLAFEGLTPGRQRAYIFYFSEPKQSKTRIARVEKYIDHILDGKGLIDK